MERNIIVFGATGKTGIEITKELDSKQIKHTVFVREVSKGKITNSSTPKILGDVLNLEEVEVTFKNETFTDVIISLGSKDFKSTMIRSIGTGNIVNALAKNQSKTTIHVVSALGVGESWNQLKWHAKLISNLLIKSTMNDHTAQEDIIIKSTIPYHIIRCVGLKDGETKGDVHVQNTGFLPSNSIQRADVAKFIVKSMLEGKTGINGICQKVD